MVTGALIIHDRTVHAAAAAAAAFHLPHHLIAWGKSGSRGHFVLHINSAAQRVLADWLRDSCNHGHVVVVVVVRLTHATGTS